MADTLTHRTVKNSIYSFVGFVWPLLLSFITTPIIIRSLGSARFGFFSLLNSITLVFGLLDFGLNYTLVKHLSENRINQANRELSITFSSTTILYSVLGLIGLLCLLLLQGVFRFWFKIPEGFISSFGLAFFILGSTFFLQMVTVPLSQIPFALQRQDIPTKISMINNVLVQVGSILVLITGHSVLSLLVIQLISASFLLLSFYFVWHHLAPDLKFLPVLSKSVVKTIGQQGFWVFIRNNMINILGQLDKFVLGAIWGPTAVGYYSTAQMIPSKISDTSFSLSHIFFPIFSEVSSQKAEAVQRVKSIFRRSLGIISIITSGLTILVLLYGYYLVRYWVGGEFADHTILALPILALTYFLLSLGNFFQAFLSGLKELKFLAVSTMILAGVDVLFMLILIPRHSVNGASWAYLFSALPMPVFLYYIERKYLQSSKRELADFYGKLFAKIFFVGCLTFLIGWLVVRPLINNLILAVTLGGMTFLIYLALFWVFNFYSAEDRTLLKSYIRRVCNFGLKDKLT